jgi:diadenosine tetraphosphatase ApaH/serine/threonine PP2A family protein phosphatase
MIAAAWPTVRGNHDRMLIDPPDPMPEWDSDALAGLAKRHLDWIRTLPVTMRIDGVFLCHATPHDDATRWLNRLDAQGHVLQRPLAEITRLAEEVGEGLIFCGHSHVAEAVPLGDGRLIVNPGSVGCPGFINDDPGLSRVVTGTPHARYAIVDSTPRGWAVSFRAIPYDTAPAIALARRRGRTEWVEVLGTGWIG